MASQFLRSFRSTMLTLVIATMISKTSSFCPKMWSVITPFKQVAYISAWAPKISFIFVCFTSPFRLSVSQSRSLICRTLILPQCSSHFCEMYQSVLIGLVLELTVWSCWFNTSSMSSYTQNQLVSLENFNGFPKHPVILFGSCQDKQLYSSNLITIQLCFHFS